ncbi:tRNA(5-methylaminomethyl-2-thiouridylate)-methyl transferase [Thermodesulfatator indicus DSM 15286]|uniref:tRNA-specific 2-thiouridylase MnmA n=1 Tax=Thermodesulfatator indicus (strain DSM 15286 / JCM 11887 / CIR29812) TaxID=667014 RepID=F8AB45_THEID|nr:tRNA 2-thiouridine(34) synthase MnmA [Thermodesulfatator indicus]AEH44416.1 tRNA(5-methylaminomethyl-2-thiouridylate)-methyl transferase [Thermodesulfatator indicus DSM 15286]
MIAVAMSGGVDSTFAAHLLKKQGKNIFGLFALFSPKDPEKEIVRVKRLTDALKIDLKIVDLTGPFKEKIISYFLKSYRQGLTPNPCVVCNRKIKFGLLLEEAQKLGAQKIATGHYARVIFNEENQCFELFKGKDPGKEQSYFLALLNQKQLSRALFPLGEWKKEDVIKEIVKLGLFNLTSPESQEVCFIRGDYRELFSEEDFPPGEMITVDGRVVGKHQGIYAYTIGQRRGLGVRLGRPYYVVAINAQKNQVIIGPKKYLRCERFLVKNFHLICDAYRQEEIKANVRIRYRHKEAPATIKFFSEKDAEVVFEKPQQAVTPGQFAVAYQEDKVLGGGEIHLKENFIFAD